MRSGSLRRSPCPSCRTDLFYWDLGYDRVSASPAFMQPAPSETSPGRWDYVGQIDSAVCGFDPDWLRLWALSASPTYARPPLIGAFFFVMNSSDIEACQQCRGPLASYFWALAACGRCWMTRGQRSCFRRDRNFASFNLDTLTYLTTVALGMPPRVRPGEEALQLLGSCRLKECGSSL